MKNYTVKVRLNNGSHVYFDCEAENEFDAKQQAGWAYVREGTVVCVF